MALPTNNDRQLRELMKLVAKMRKSTQALYEDTWKLADWLLANTVTDGRSDKDGLSIGECARAIQVSRQYLYRLRQMAEFIPPHERTSELSVSHAGHVWDQFTRLGVEKPRYVSDVVSSSWFKTIGKAQTAERFFDSFLKDVAGLDESELNDDELTALGAILQRLYSKLDVAAASFDMTEA
jgi:hypothetical protein